MAKKKKKKEEELPSFNRIKSVLALKKKKIKWLASELDMGVSTVSKWCQNRTQPKIETLFRISEVLKVGVRELLEPTEFDKPGL
jgi:transcriptional regulator with XRE-family HTH domain